jgi:hypothetical protein
MLSLVDRLLESAPGYLHFAVYSVLNSEEYIKRLNTYIDCIIFNWIDSPPEHHPE